MTQAVAVTDYVAAFDLALEYGKVAQRPKLRVKDVKKGQARYRTWSCTLPLWPMYECEEYAVCYAVHEACHFIVKSWQDTKRDFIGHGHEFKKLENEILAMFDLRGVHSKAYIHYLYQKSTGNLLWTHTGGNVSG